MIYNVFNKDLLIRCRESHFPGQHIELALPPDIISKKKEDKIEKIRKYRKQEWRTQFLVYQKGYGDEYDQQITETELPHAKEAIENYWTRISS